MNDAASPADRIRQARSSAGLTQIQVSLRARISLSTLRLAERGVATTRTLNKVAQALGVRIDDLTNHVPQAAK